MNRAERSPQLGNTFKSPLANYWNHELTTVLSTKSNVSKLTFNRLFPWWMLYNILRLKCHVRVRGSNGYGEEFLNVCCKIFVVRSVLPPSRGCLNSVIRWKWSSSSFVHMEIEPANNPRLKLKHNLKWRYRGKISCILRPASYCEKNWREEYK